MSYGQQKRVTLLRSLLKYHLENALDPCRVHLFLLDEVFSGIHWELRNVIISIFEELREVPNFSILWIAHANDPLRDVCDCVYCLSAKRIVAVSSGKPEYCAKQD